MVLGCGPTADGLMLDKNESGKEARLFGVNLSSFKSKDPFETSVRSQRWRRVPSNDPGEKPPDGSPVPFSD